jgi:hypothetical protein
LTGNINRAIVHPSAANNQHEKDSIMNQQALSAFTARVAEINEKTARLQELAGEHFGYDVESINWAHTGTVAHVSELLSEILAKFD